MHARTCTHLHTSTHTCSHTRQVGSRICTEKKSEVLKMRIGVVLRHDALGKERVSGK